MSTTIHCFVIDTETTLTDETIGLKDGSFLWSEIAIDGYYNGFIAKQNIEFVQKIDVSRGGGQIYNLDFSDNRSSPGITWTNACTCKVATTQNITLSGEQTIDGVSCSAGDTVLVKDQGILTPCGIEVARKSY